MKAKIKFNGGIGALLCEICDRIIATGTKHKDIHHYCLRCKKEYSDDRGREEDTK